MKFNSLLLCSVAACGTLATAAQTKEPRRILMIGNSLTYTYNVPDELAGIAKGKGRKLQVDSFVRGGVLLAWHLENDIKGVTARDKILKGKYDCVVAQDGYNGLFKPDGPEKMELAIEAFSGFAREAGTELVLYTAFARTQDQESKRVDDLVRMYTEQALKHKLRCAPVVLAFQAIRRQNPELALLDNETGKKYALDKTGTHQSPYGSYLAACVIYATLFDESPEGTKFRQLSDGTELTEAEALEAQQVAWKIWQEYKPRLDGAD